MSRCLLALLALLAAAPLPAAETGTITGYVDRGSAVTAISAIDRNRPDAQYPGSIDAHTGRFTIKELPLGATYDVILAAGHVSLEGVNIRVPRSDYEEEQPLSRDDADSLRKIVLSLNKFENEIDVLGIFGNIQHAAVVLNKRRTVAFYGSRPSEMIWRLEVWRFERPDEHWVKRQDELATVHYRKRMSQEEYAKLSLTLDPALGGLELTTDRPRVDLPAVKLPAAVPGIHLRMSAEKK